MSSTDHDYDVDPEDPVLALLTGRLRRLPTSNESDFEARVADAITELVAERIRSSNARRRS